MVIRFILVVALLIALFVWVKDQVVTGKAIVLIDKKPHPVWTPRLKYYLGYLYYIINDHKRGITCFEQIIKKYPKSDKAEDAEYMLGVCYESMTEFRKAIAAYKKLLEDYPKTEYQDILKKRLEILEH